MEYSGLSNSTYTDVNSDGLYCVTDLITWGYTNNQRNIPFVSFFICWFGV